MSFQEYQSIVKLAAIKGLDNTDQLINAVGLGGSYQDIIKRLQALPTKRKSEWVK